MGTNGSSPSFCSARVWSPLQAGEREDWQAGVNAMHSDASHLSGAAGRQEAVAAAGKLKTSQQRELQLSWLGHLTVSQLPVPVVACTP